VVADDVDLLVGDQLVQAGLGDVALVERRAGRDVLALAGREVVENDDAVAVGEGCR
jgi:hypothetical protein